MGRGAMVLLEAWIGIEEGTCSSNKKILTFLHLSPLGFISFVLAKFHFVLLARFTQVTPSSHVRDSSKFSQIPKDNLEGYWKPFLFPYVRDPYHKSTKQIPTKGFQLKGCDGDKGNVNGVRVNEVSVSILSENEKEEQWSGAMTNLMEMASNLDSPQKLLLTKVIFINDNTFSQASLAADQARFIKTVKLPPDEDINEWSLCIPPKKSLCINIFRTKGEISAFLFVSMTEHCHGYTKSFKWPGHAETENWAEERFHYPGVLCRKILFPFHSCWSKPMKTKATAEFEIDFPVKAWLEEKMLLTTDKTLLTCCVSKVMQSYAYGLVVGVEKSFSVGSKVHPFLLHFHKALFFFYRGKGIFILFYA
ncbi:hypothetical protein JHK87_001003 [Glycine soja]|nr:hypothetical protein JHK87_001003 [Glycine soja]